MERLTEKHYAKSDYYINCSGNCTADLKCEDCINLQMVINRLGSYEDTGLTPEQVADQRWIPVTEKVPENEFPVLATCGKGYRPFVARYDLIWKRWRVSHTLKITHWMPLPTSPKEA